MRGRFHLRNGFYFARNEDGSVVIEVEPGTGEPITVEVGPSEWASVLASVCARRESGATHAEALAFHLATPATVGDRESSP